MASNIACACEVELLIQLAHKISVRAERKVENELSSEFRRVQGKHGILARLAQAALNLPEELGRTAINPVVDTATLADIIAEAKANEKELRTRVRVKLRGSYSHHYRRGLPKLLRALDSRCNNTDGTIFPGPARSDGPHRGKAAVRAVPVPDRHGSSRTITASTGERCSRWVSFLRGAGRDRRHPPRAGRQRRHTV